MKLEISTRALARVLRAVLSGRREAIELTPSTRFLELACHILVRAASASAREALEAGKLESLGAYNKGGVVWISGRVRQEHLAVLLGQETYPSS